jgi:hypothetical protein
MRNPLTPTLHEGAARGLRRVLALGALVSALAGVLGAPAPVAAQDGHTRGDLVGNWTGAISAGGQTLRLIVSVDVGVDGSLRATLTSVDQGNTVIPVDTIAIDEDTVSFAIASIDGSYEGTMNADGSAIDGTWSQLGQSLPLALERSADP